jgi:hypothetical protein
MTTGTGTSSGGPDLQPKSASPAKAAVA